MHRRAPEALRVPVGRVGSIDGVDAGAPGRRQDLDPGEVPEVAGVLADRVEVAVDPGPQRGREVAGPEDDRPPAGRWPGRSRRRWRGPRPPRSGPRARCAWSGRSLVSSWVRRTSTHHTSRAVRALGTMSTSSDSRAPVTTSMMSPWHHGVSRPFTRTARTVRPQSKPVSAATAVPRAASLATGAQASSRSKKTRSAPEPAAFSHIRSLLAGVASSERRARGCSHSCLPEPSRSDDTRARRAARRSGSMPSRSPKTASLSAPRPRPRWVIRPGVLGQDGDRCLHGHRARGRGRRPGRRCPGPAGARRPAAARRRRRVRRPPRPPRRRPWPRQGAPPDPVGHQCVDLSGPLLPGDGVDVVGILGQVGPVDGPVDAGGDVRATHWRWPATCRRRSGRRCGGRWRRSGCPPGRRPSPAGRRPGWRTR